MVIFIKYINDWKALSEKIWCTRFGMRRRIEKKIYIYMGLVLNNFIIEWKWKIRSRKLQGFGGV